MFLLEQVPILLNLQKVILRIDNHALFLMKNHSRVEEIPRSSLTLLQQYNLEIIQRPKTEHANANGMTRRSTIYFMPRRNDKNEIVGREVFSISCQKK